VEGNVQDQANDREQGAGPKKDASRQRSGRRRRGNPLAAGIAGAIYGGVSGALIGASLNGSEGAWLGAAIGALYFGLVEAITDVRRKPGELKPLWHRFVASVVIGAAAAAAAGFFISNPLVIGLIMGLLVGLAGLGPRKLVVGLGLGLLAGFAASAVDPDFNAAILGGFIVLIDRILLIVLFDDPAPMEVTGEQIPPEEARYIVPYKAHGNYVGADYAVELAEETQGTCSRNKPDIGIVETLEELDGPQFNPRLVDPLIREFYEHTSRFKLTIVPEWKLLIKPFFWFFKTYLAQNIGQANLPFNTEEIQRGLVSYIDTIDYDEPLIGGSRTLRVWVRAYEMTGEAIYVGIYTIVRQEETGYVSVGFPLPEANFTASLMPFNNRGNGLLLKTAGTGSRFPGHYLSDVDDEDGTLTTVKLPTMDEEIDVYVEDGHLKTNHRFYLGGWLFLTLYYMIERKGDLTGAEKPDI
jgi:hypothetical protein